MAKRPGLGGGARPRRCVTLAGRERAGRGRARGHPRRPRRRGGSPTGCPSRRRRPIPPSPPHRRRQRRPRSRRRPPRCRPPRRGRGTGGRSPASCCWWSCPPPRRPPICYCRAADQYHSRVAFSVRSEEVGAAAAGARRADPDRRRHRLGRRHPLRVHPQPGDRRGDRRPARPPDDLEPPGQRLADGDPVFTLGADPSIEALHGHWRRMVAVAYDASRRDHRRRRRAPSRPRTRGRSPRRCSRESSAAGERTSPSRRARTRCASPARSSPRPRRHLRGDAPAELADFRRAHNLVDPTADVAGQSGLLERAERRARRGAGRRATC